MGDVTRFASCVCDSNCLDTSQHSLCRPKFHNRVPSSPTAHRRSRYLACGLLFRGDVVISDVNANIENMAADLDMISWNREGFKIGLCSVPSMAEEQSMLCLSNNCCIQ